MAPTTALTNFHQSRLHAELHSGRVGDRTLSAKVHLAALDEFGAIEVPENTTSILMEVGAGDYKTWDGRVLEYYPTDFLISFEPLLDKYSVLLSRGHANALGNRTRDKTTPLGQHHSRGVVLPLAVSRSGGEQTMHVAQTAGCSSLLKVNPRADWGAFCKKGIGDRPVPSISLQTALGLAGRLPIRIMNLVTQGIELDLLKSVPQDFLRERVQSISMNVIAADCEPLYENQPRCPEVLSTMRDLGYIPKTFHGKPPLTVSCLKADFAQVNHEDNALHSVLPADYCSLLCAPKRVCPCRHAACQKPWKNVGRRMDSVRARSLLHLREEPERAPGETGGASRITSCAELWNSRKRGLPVPPRPSWLSNGGPLPFVQRDGGGVDSFERSVGASAIAHWTSQSKVGPHHTSGLGSGDSPDSATLSFVRICFDSLEWQVCGKLRVR